MSEEERDKLIEEQIGTIERLERQLEWYDRTLEEKQKEITKRDKTIKELNDKIEDDKMIIEGNWGCIDNLRKDYNLQKNIIKEVREEVKIYEEQSNDGTTNELDNYVFVQRLKKVLDKENKQCIK